MSSGGGEAYFLACQEGMSTQSNTKNIINISFRIFRILPANSATSERRNESWFRHKSGSENAFSLSYI